MEIHPEVVLIHMGYWRPGPDGFGRVPLRDMKIRIKRVYEPAVKDDGIRVLVDRLWPRGIKKEAIDLWLKDIAPSKALRHWYGHVPGRWEEFRKRYLKELEANETGLCDFVRATKGKTVTLLYGSRDTERNQATVIRDFLTGSRAEAAKGKN